jgi:hypothetical protein
MEASSIPERDDMPRVLAPFRPLVDRVASIQASVHTKLLAGFLSGALLLMAMGGLSVAVQAHMADREQELNSNNARVDRLRQMQYLITAQSHYRAMALLKHDQANLDSLASAKTQFLAHLDAI